MHARADITAPVGVYVFVPKILEPLKFDLSKKKKNNLGQLFGMNCLSGLGRIYIETIYILLRLTSDFVNLHRGEAEVDTTFEG